jgi:hypothetical protein
MASAGTWGWHLKGCHHLTTKEGGEGNQEGRELSSRLLGLVRSQGGERDVNALPLFFSFISSQASPLVQLNLNPEATEACSHCLKVIFAMRNMEVGLQVQTKTSPASKKEKILLINYVTTLSYHLEILV